MAVTLKENPQRNGGLSTIRGNVMKIVVLLHTYNGVEYLGEQLQSLLKQDISGKAEVKILVRDDGSTDKTSDILDRYHREEKIEWIKGETIGKTRSFWELLAKAPEADYYAFCDQDDVWMPEKLSRAVKYLETQAILDGDDEELDVSVGPLLYQGDYTVTNAILKPIKFTRNKTTRLNDFQHSLLYSTTPGCTYVFNASAKDLMLRYDVNTKFAGNYDDLARNIIHIVGTVIRDWVPTMYLRKSKTDAFYDNYYGGFFGSIKQNLALSKSNNERSKLAKGLLETYGEGLEDKEKLEALKQVARYLEDTAQKERLLANHKFVTGDFNDKLFKKAVISGKL